MDFPFPFLNQVEYILNNVESSIVSIPQYIEDEQVNNEDNSVVSFANSASLDSQNNDFAEDRSTSTSVDPNNSVGTILFQSQISTVDGHQTEVVSNCTSSN